MPLMRSCSLLAILLIVAAMGANAQPGFKITFRELKSYEGTYEYANHATLQMVVSPLDTILYALVGDAKYKLRPFKKDVFLNGANQEVQFIRDGNIIAGFKEQQHPDILYHLLSKSLSFSDKMWYARQLNGKPFVYHYKVPTETNDGLKTGSIINSRLDTALIRTLINRIVDGTYANVHSILIIKDGKLVLEEYFYEYDSSKLQELRSASKSFSSAMIGIAIDKGLIKSADNPIVPFFPEYQLNNLNDEKRAITIKNLLTQQSGLDCNDDDSNSPGNEVKIYPTDDWVKYVLDLPMSDTPGHKAFYCSGNITLLNRIVEKVSGEKLHDFAAQNLFNKLGVNNFTWDFVPNKTHEDDYGQICLRPRDMAKFGLLYLNGGKWNGEQVISKEWVTQSISKHSVIRGIDYGYLWWCEPLTVNGIKYDGAEAKGNGGQRIFIWPEQNMVVIVTAGNYNTQSPANKMVMECVLAGLKK